MIEDYRSFFSDCWMFCFTFASCEVFSSHFLSAECFSASVSFFLLLLCFVILNICSSVEMLSHSFGSLVSHQQITAAEENLLVFPSFFFVLLFPTSKSLYAPVKLFPMCNYNVLLYPFSSLLAKPWDCTVSIFILSATVSLSQNVHFLFLCYLCFPSSVWRLELCHPLFPYLRGEFLKFGNHRHRCKFKPVKWKLINLFLPWLHQSLLMFFFKTIIFVKGISFQAGRCCVS